MTREPYPLSKYDDYPVHQSPYPVSHTPSTDFSFDEGYMWGAASPRLKPAPSTGHLRSKWTSVNPVVSM